MMQREQTQLVWRHKRDRPFPCFCCRIREATEKVRLLDGGLCWQFILCSRCGAKDTATICKHFGIKEG